MLQSRFLIAMVTWKEVQPCQGECFFIHWKETLDTFLLCDMLYGDLEFIPFYLSIITTYNIILNWLTWLSPLGSLRSIGPSQHSSTFFCPWQRSCLLRSSCLNYLGRLPGLKNVNQLKITFLYNISKYGGIKYLIKSLYEPE